MKTILFKNKVELQVKQEVVEILAKRITEGCTDFQLFNDGTEVKVIINVSQIVAIY